MKKIILSLLITIVLMSCDAQPSKINGISFVASREHAKKENVDAVKNIRANYAALMPFGFIKDQHSPTIIHDTDRQWFGETTPGILQYAGLLQEQDIKVMVKPHIWLWHGGFTGNLKMETEAEWKLLENTYTSFILTYAKAAQEINAEIFCIGTELEQFVMARPSYWSNLISEIRKVYDGELTYAANWDEYTRTPFWKEVDYIGVDGYFPLSKEKTPTIEQARAGWQPWKIEMQKLSEANNKPILFTEYGFRSVDFSGKEPWVSDHRLPGVNLEAQTNLMISLFEELYPEPWFKGGFIWKWFIDDASVGGLENNRFTPQNKPVEAEIKKYFGLYAN